MIYLLFVLAIILGLVIAALFIKSEIMVEYQDARIAITYRCLFVKFTIDSSRFKKDKKGSADTKKSGQGAFSKIKDLHDNFDDIKEILVEILDLLKNRAEFSGIFIRVRYGTGDAAITGMIYGAIWALVGNIYSLLARAVRIEFPTVELQPVFGGKAFEIEAEGIIRARLVHIITAAVRSLKVYKKHKKEKGAE